MKSVMLLLFASLFLVTFNSKANSHRDEKQAHITLSVEDRVRESIFRYQFAKWGVLDKDSNKHFFIGIGYKAKDYPSPGLIAALQVSAYSVKGISQCKRSVGGVFDAKTGEKGVAFIVSDLTFPAKDKAQARASFVRNGKAGNEAVYTVDYINGRWQVTKIHLTHLH